MTPKHECSHELDWGEYKEFKPNIMIKINELQTEMRDGFKEIKSLIEGLDNKYASKTVEKIVYTMCALILTAFMVAIIGLVIIQKGT